MADYAKYYLPFLMQVVSAAGFLLGGNYIWLGIATFPALTIVDSLLPLDFAPRRMNSRGLQPDADDDARHPARRRETASDGGGGCETASRSRRQQRKGVPQSCAPRR